MPLAVWMWCRAIVLPGLRDPEWRTIHASSFSALGVGTSIRVRTGAGVLRVRDARRHHTGDALVKVVEVRTEVGCLLVESLCDHSAADVDPDARRHDRAAGVHDRTDGGAEPEVGVGHEG